jgi:hypothetical protein
LQSMFPTAFSGILLKATMRDETIQQNHWSERGRATSVANSDASGRPRRSVGSFADDTMEPIATLHLIHRYGASQ